jgi:hypothetical protein
MHTPITTLKTAAKESEATTVVDVVRRLFNLHDKKKKQEDTPRSNENQEKNDAKKNEVGTRQ